MHPLAKAIKGLSSSAIKAMDPQLLQLLTVVSIPIGLISVAIGIYLTGRLIKEGIDGIRVEIKEGIEVMAEVVKSIHEGIQRSQRKLEAEVGKSRESL